MNVHIGPVGVFDSGLGGLSVVREVRRLLPREDVLYVADSAHCPYGSQPPAAILARARTIGAALIERGAKLLVVACNTASSVALAHLRAEFSATPIVGLVPAVKPAAAATRTGGIAVLATPRTIAGEILAELIRDHAAGAEMILVPAPGLADLLEAGETSGPRVEAVLRPMLAPLPARGVDTLVLGCTHYPFLRDAIGALVGPGVTLFDSGDAVARRARDVLEVQALRNPDERRGTLALLTTGDPARVGAVASRLLGGPVTATWVGV